MIDAILGNVDRIKLGFDVGIKVGSLDVYFGGSNLYKFEVLLLVDSLGFTDGKVIGYYEGIKL